MREFMLYFAAQASIYSLATLNYRACAQGRLARTLITDAMLAALGFLVIRHIATDATTWPAFAGYVSGGLAGTTIAMLWDRR
jgi:hypothetical protein